MVGIGIPELGFILLIGLVVFGPGKLPDVGKALGKSIREFKQATTDEPTQPAAPAQTTVSAQPQPEEKKQA